MGAPRVPPLNPSETIVLPNTNRTNDMQAAVIPPLQVIPVVEGGGGVSGVVGGEGV